LSNPILAYGRQRIAIEDLTVEARIGIADWERAAGKRQRLTFNVAVYRDAFGHEQTIDDCFDYVALQTFLTGFAGRPHMDLLETVLAEVLDFCFTDPRIAAVEASVAKPDVFNGRGAPALSTALMRADWEERR
jgi:7,8-dihydroneopterin aldolase/epimerase/oxygenase